MSRAFWRSVAGVMLLGAALAAQAPQRPDAPLNLQDPIPFDTAVQTGTLPNGLKYFIRQNPRPEKRVSLRLAVKAGSLFEADDQQGLAHLIEHMAFNGSAHFAPGELVSYFESMGARLGPHVNAYTSFDETVYMLDLPSDKSEVVAKGLTALADFAGELTISHAASSSRSGAGGSAPVPASAISRSPSSTTSPDTRNACRSASPRFCARHPRPGCARSMTPGIAPSEWPSSSSATLRRPTSPPRFSRHSVR